jgi:ubiquinone/menaquinone biosynthesis C-methylase UbiE
MAWHEHHTDVFTGTELFFRPGYLANLTSSWLPALTGVEEKLLAGGRIADVGCGLGASTVLLAQRYPDAAIVGSDYHETSIELARKRAAESGVGDRVSFEVASAQAFAGTGYDLVATFDCLHDMGDPLAAAGHIRQALAGDGSWLIVEPFAGDTVEENLNPVGRAFYSFSSYLCVPNARSQDGGYALGAQAGEAAIREVVLAAGFREFRRAAQTPFNLVFEARP